MILLGMCCTKHMVFLKKDDIQRIFNVDVRWFVCKKNITMSVLMDLKKWTVWCSAGINPFHF